MDTILHPIMWLISWVMYGIHSALTAIGMQGGAGPAWVLSILGLTITVRLIVLPLYNKQIRASRETQLLQPEIQKIQKKYKGKKDPISQQRQQEELTALYKKHGTSPFSSCLPALVQMPILFALYRVLYAFPQIAAGNKDALGPITREVAQNFQHSTIFGAPLSASFSDPGQGNQTTVRIVAAVLVLIMSASMFYTQRQLTMKNMPENAMDPNNPAFKTQKYMMYGMPVIYLFSGVAFQIGVLVYWVFGNLWTIGQQSWFIRTNPTPGSRAYREREARIRRKRLRQGMTEEEIDQLEAEEQRGGQRQQPLGKARSKKAAQKSVSAVAENVEEQTEVPTEVRGKDGLTDAERARKRYERRQAERARSRAKAQARQKNAQQNKKQRNF
ncbi:MAG: membrane protein insertase YidC [Ancrocorticia sp.]|nr:membrane protein insertase YidC [Ancrocorticia sp.]MCI2002777.1 membrane protein insertase YidC [Ancrocorticia sp.]MCI2012097.1 membrane protein insertase YidC [Ancrocorticia sp.]MCI2029788.1 membrane protein insertase YidC [Ancrocorticia sp.]